jgi:hypothetical protein
MKKTKTSDPGPADHDELRPEYRFDYAKARPNRFAGRVDPERVVVLLDPDVSEVFRTPESVNAMLRALIAAMPTVPKKTRSGS